MGIFSYIRRKREERQVKKGIVGKGKNVYEIVLMITYDGKPYRKFKQRIIANSRPEATIIANSSFRIHAQQVSKPIKHLK
jgi:hypothetical protein